MKNKIQSAQETTIFLFDKEGVYSTDLLGHIMESAEETTTPIGIGRIDYVNEVIGHAFQHSETKDIINENEYNELEEEEAENYEFYGETTIGFQLRKWIGHGSKSMTIAEYDDYNDAQDALFEAYMYDFETDDQRDTMYYLTEAEALEAYEEYKTEISNQ